MRITKVIEQMRRTKPKYKPGENPQSLKALEEHRYKEGRPPIYGSSKKQRYLSVTEEGWEGAQEIVREAGYSGISDLIEKLGRKQVKLPRLQGDC